MRRTGVRVAVALVVLCFAQTAGAVFHLSVIDEVLTSYGGDQNVQFIEMRMLAGFQTAVANSVFAVFDASGTYTGDLLVVPGNVTNQGVDVRWLIGTSAFQTASGVTPDFIMPPGILPTGGGMVCFGGGGGFLPQNPPNWVRTDFTTYVDCVAYGTYAGSTNAKIGTPTALNGDGHSLQRTTNTHDNAADFTCADPATPENNAGMTMSMPATSPCSGGATPTPTPTVSVPPVAACVGDCNGDGMVGINELILGVNIALGTSQLSECEAFACEGGDTVPINCLVQGVNSDLNGCPATPTPTETAIVEATSTRTPGGPLGARRFSINPDTSSFTAVLASGFKFPTSGVQGFLVLDAGPPDANNGLAFIDITDASEYISVDIPAGGTAVCLRIPHDQFPVHNAGLVTCKGGLPLGLQVTQDHDIGVVGKCSGGGNGGMSCSGAADCPDGQCFTAAACAAAGGTVEGPERPHPGVCNGMLGGQLPTDIAAPGTVLIAPDPSPAHLINGLQVEVTQEHATPCGDEGAVGRILSIAFTSGHAYGEIQNFNNVSGMALTDDFTGESFSCAGWSEENGPGTLVLAAPQLDTPVNGAPSDILAEYDLHD